MRDVRIKKYQKKYDYSYALGLYPTIELLEKKPNKAIKILLSDKANKTPELKKIIDLCRKNHVRFEFADRIIEKIAYKENTYAIGIFEKYTTQLNSAQNHVVLVNISDMGNLGTIIRTMAGFNFENLVMIKPAADIFDPRVVRSSMGGLFELNFEYFSGFDEYKSIFTSHNFYSFMLNGSKTLSETEFEAPYSLIFGNEGAGLDESFKDVGKSISIEQSKNIDSLNLSISVGIALYKAKILKG